MNQFEKVALQNVEIGQSKYVLPNGLEFKTKEEVDAFLKGLEFAQANAEIAIEMVKRNTLNVVNPNMEF